MQNFKIFPAVYRKNVENSYGLATFKLLLILPQKKKSSTTERETEIYKVMEDIKDRLSRKDQDFLLSEDVLQLLSRKSKSRYENE